MNAVAVFCGSKLGKHDLFALHAAQLGKLLAREDISLVYGGGNKGLMGAVADGALSEGGKVVGIIPDHLVAWEQQHLGLTELVVVPDMHTRKRLIYERCNAAIILPGGFGTMDELFELLTWNQLSLHNKPVFILNSAGFYTDLFQMMQVMHHNEFLYDNFYERVKIADTPDGILTLLAGAAKT
jgi:uncharacterized protein (TIGR00730 family)